MKKICFRSVLAGILACACVFSLVAFFLQRKQRSIFYFSEIGTERLVAEVRYLPKNPVQGNIALYVDELLLGPETQRARPLFSAGTKNEFCFQRGRTLYVGLSKDVLYEIPEAEPITRGIALFKKNITRNFRGIATVALFIDGKYVE